MRDKALSAANQQETGHITFMYPGSSETTRRAPSSATCKAYLLGALHDGTFNKYNQRYRFVQSGTAWLKILKHCLAVVGYNSWMYKEGSNRRVYVLETLAKFLDTQFNPLRFETLGEIKAYLRGFFDAEGGIPKNPKAKFYIQLVQNNKPKLEKIRTLLERLGISTGVIHNPSFKVDPDYFRMFVSRNSHGKFLQEIYTWHPRKLRTLKRRMMI